MGSNTSCINYFPNANRSHKNDNLINIYENNNEIKHNLIEFNVCSFNVRLAQSANYIEKVEGLINYLTTSKNNVICLQNINDTKILKHIVKRIFKYNLTATQNNKLLTYPMIETFYLNSGDINVSLSTSALINNTLKLTWSNSDDNNIDSINSLIITKENIISCSKAEMTSFQLNEKTNWVYVVNIEWHGYILSIYNTTFQNDFVGISNVDLRKIQIKEIKSIVESNSLHISKDEEYSEFINKKINIVCCQSNIKELLNNEVNQEYLYFTRTLKSLDTHRYVQTLKGINMNTFRDATDLSGSRNNYILLSGLETTGYDNVEHIGKDLYINHNLIIINSQVKTLNFYEDNPIISTFLMRNININNVQKVQRNISSSEIAIEII